MLEISSSARFRKQFSPESLEKRFNSASSKLLLWLKHNFLPQSPHSELLSLSQQWLQLIYLPSLKTSYASESSLNLLFASSKLSGFLSGCHFNANFLYLRNENMPDVALARLVKNNTTLNRHFARFRNSAQIVYNARKAIDVDEGSINGTYAFFMSAPVAVRCTSSTL